jgi:hypothetical protein
VIESIPQDNPTHLASVDQFYIDCAAGSLPAVSFVDSDIGAAPVATGASPAPFSGSSDPVSNQNQDEENGDLSLGENFVSQVVNAVLSSPAWPRILLLWTYDEHGGWYDHVPPPAAILPDSIPPKLSSGDVPGTYNIYGPRVPAVAVSGYSKPNAVTNVVHDHTSVLATIQAKWNLPAMTYRDANAATMADFLDTKVRFPEPPKLAAPSDLSQSEQSCDSSAIKFAVHPNSPPRAGRQRLLVTYSVRRPARAIEVHLRVSRGTRRHLVVELTRGQRVLARASVGVVGTAARAVTLRPGHGRAFSRGHYELVVKHGAKTLARRGVIVAVARRG